PGSGSGGVASFEVVPATAWMQTGDALTLTAIARDAGGAELSGRVVKWESSNATHAAVSAAGIVAAAGTGAARITATLGDRKASTDIVVTDRVQSASAWHLTTSGGSDATLLGMWAATATDAYAVGQDGYIAHFDGRQWTRMTTPTQETLVGVWGAS